MCIRDSILTVLYILKVSWKLNTKETLEAYESKYFFFYRCIDICNEWNLNHNLPRIQYFGGIIFYVLVHNLCYLTCVNTIKISDIRIQMVSFWLFSGKLGICSPCFMIFLLFRYIKQAMDPVRVCVIGLGEMGMRIAG